MTLSETATIEARIRAVFAEVLAAQNPGLPPAPVEADTVLLDSGLDSLGFAILVTRLEEDLGYDPFTLASEAYYPQTFGAFVAFYADNRPQ